FSRSITITCLMALLGTDRSGPPAAGAIGTQRETTTVAAAPAAAVDSLNARKEASEGPQSQRSTGLEDRRYWFGRTDVWQTNRTQRAGKQIITRTAWTRCHALNLRVSRDRTAAELHQLANFSDDAVDCRVAVQCLRERHRRVRGAHSS